MIDVDNVGVVVVDGNFKLYGKIIFANKIILHNLNYSSNELVNRSVKTLMPTDISNMHDKFWT